MCGRFTLTIEISELQREFRLGVVPSDWIPRYNISPSQNIVVVNNPNNRDLIPMRWGLVPHWAKDKSIGYKMINARGETVGQKPAFKKSFDDKRCLIPADGFYEWRKESAGSKKISIPYYFHFENRIAFMFAGLWDQWTSNDGEVINSCSIITCEANDIVKPVHHRMPVILDKDTCWSWLTEENATERQKMLSPYSAIKMKSFQVSREVNSPSNDSRDNILPV